MRQSSPKLTKIARLFALAVVVAVTLTWATVAYAQSNADQYGSPTEQVSNPAGHVLSVLPDTGGSALVLIIGGLVLTGTGLLIVRGRR